MTITKKDTVVLAVLFNIVVLAGVLATAHQLAPKVDNPLHERPSSAVERCADEKDSSDRGGLPEEGIVAFDEIDQLLEEYISEDTPETTAVTSAPQEMKKPVKNEAKKTREMIPSDAYYTVKAGDNPWKIAKKFHLSFERLLQLNHLDEAKARNLKIGQKLKIKETS
jgi:hypothetical protein